MPLPIIAAYYGSPYFDLLAALICIVMAWEWQMMLENKFSTSGVIVAATASNVCLITVHSVSAALIFIAVITALMFFIKKRMKRDKWRLFWVCVPYISFGLGSLVYVRQFGGFETIIWLLCVIWATDTGAYVFGRLIGGAKLMPSVSPNKTIAGLVGGMFCAACIGIAAVYYLELSNYLLIASISTVLALFAQSGDLFESWIKRKVGVKDSSNIIPGHGGVFDRLDGLIAASPVVALIVWFAEGGLDKWL